MRFRAETLYKELKLLLELRPIAKAALVAEAQKDPAWQRLRTIPFLGPVRVALILAAMQTPWRFRDKRSLWAYSGFAVVTWTSAEYEMDGGKAVRRRRPPRTRGLNRNHNPVLKEVFKSAATAATVRAGALRDLYEGMLTRGMDKDLARVTLARIHPRIELNTRFGRGYRAARIFTSLARKVFGEIVLIQSEELE